ncbi:transcriptional regulator [Bacterioplanes sanyensis]|uniref:Transcriptional regulator n=1 Tax=Bacterioplanes sanyensis TaxID=1249553 RepID=A0A222FEW0_9GAMM|nr:GNAT family N-acetyltransferase [Bacterioplanes sanyensis]ASP37548.1 transcriptional regulator [Bacterioplanes sanyensis]
MHFEQHTPIGKMSLVPFSMDEHLPLFHQWVTQPYAHFWGYQDFSLAALAQEYQTLQQQGHTLSLGLHQGTPAFVVETYDPTSVLAEHYQAGDGDIGMHLLLAPAQQPIAGFSRHVFATVMAGLFAQGHSRVVVEPDARNHAIHTLNSRFGFRHHGPVDLGHKHAFIGLCQRRDFDHALQLQQCDGDAPQHALSLRHQPQRACEPLTSEIWRQANAEQVAKCISEAAHERLITPEAIDGGYQLVSGAARYQFKARKMALEHWCIEPGSIQRWHNQQPCALDAVQWVVEFQSQLGLSQQQLNGYLEELANTLYGRAYKLARPGLTCEQLAQADFQTLEAAMSEGHPAFIANNGRLGFDQTDLRTRAPESGSVMRLVWLAAHRDFVCLSHLPEMDYQQWLEQEFDATTLARFQQQLAEQGLSLSDYVLIPAHPWQWQHKLASIYAAELAQQRLVMLGHGDDYYQAQQSIRTFFNRSYPQRNYVKTALSVINMGFVRGLSAQYMKVTPAINDWLYQKLNNDAQLQASGFTLLREICAVGYQQPFFNDAELSDHPFKKTLAGLWRESPVALLKPGQTLTTMAALLHQDKHGHSLAAQWIKTSGLSAKAWLTAYLEAYFVPLLHCFYAHKLVFMPHGENLILIMENGVPVRALMKDIGEEVCLLNSEQALPAEVERIRISMPEDKELLSIFTDVFDGVFRYLSQQLWQADVMDEDTFWRTVAEVAQRYQAQHPELQQRFAHYDLFCAEFDHSCLNRLQLRNHRQMVDLTDPAGSLVFAGTLKNPLAAYALEPCVD